MESEAKTGAGEGKAGCITLLFSFVAIEGGIVLTAWALHHVLGYGPGRDTGMAALAVTGVLITFAGPQLRFLARRAWPRVTWRQAAASLPDFSLAGWFVLGWAAPQVTGEYAAGLLSGIVVLEFIIIHASVGLVAFPQQMAREVRAQHWWNTPRAILFWLLLLYSLFAAGISAAFKTGWLFVSFWFLIANKFLDDWLSPAAEAEERRRRHMARWGTSAGLYLFLAFGSIFIPVPRLGAFSVTDGDGLWEQNPEQAVALGALYYAVLGFCELYGGFKKAPEAQAA
jgi:hypothetical protein